MSSQSRRIPTIFSGSSTVRNFCKENLGPSNFVKLAGILRLRLPFALTRERQTALRTTN